MKRVKESDHGIPSNTSNTSSKHGAISHCFVVSLAQSQHFITKWFPYLCFIELTTTFPVYLFKICVTWLLKRIFFAALKNAGTEFKTAAWWWTSISFNTWYKAWKKSTNTGKLLAPSSEQLKQLWRHVIALCDVSSLWNQDLYFAHYSEAKFVEKHFRICGILNFSLLLILMGIKFPWHYNRRLKGWFLHVLERKRFFLCMCLFKKTHNSVRYVSIPSDVAFAVILMTQMRLNVYQQFLLAEAIDWKDARIPTGEHFNITDCVFNNWIIMCREYSSLIFRWHACATCCIWSTN